MEYSLYVYGGGQILANVFNGIAMLFKSENPYFTSVGHLTMVVGLLYIAAQAIPRGSISLLFKSWFLPTFLLVALFYGPKATVHIIDKADKDQHYTKISDIPVGLAAVASLSTHLSEYLTESVETLFTNSDAERFSKTGCMFGAKLIEAASRLTIKDPLMKENLKDFTRQCFAWPYIFSNIAPGKKKALEATDILEFISSNPHPLLGIYWRESNGSTSFMNCTTCAAKIKEVIGIEVNNGLEALAQDVFGAQVNPERTTHRLTQYFGEAWGKLAKGANESSKIIQQELMLNSYREALQDKRDELMLGRSAVEMAHLNAARGIAQQDNSFFVKAIMAGTLVPVFHTIIFSLAMIYFSLIAPMTFLPRGTTLLVQWVKVMIYLATWPVLFAILNCIGQMFASKAMATKLIGYGEGLNLLTQSGMAEVAQSAYMAVIGMQLSVPFLAWTLLWGGGYAFSQMASSFTQSGESFAAKAGAETVDGNVSFDTQSLHTRSVANTQMAQQQVGANFNYGSRFDDGKITTLYGSNRQVTLQEHQTNLGTNVAQNDTASTVLSALAANSAAAAQNKNVMAGTAFSEGIKKLTQVGNTISDGTTFNYGYGTTQTGGWQKDYSEAMKIATDFAKNNGISLDRSFQILTRAGIDAGVGTSSGVSGSLSAGAHGTWQTDAREGMLLSKAKSEGKGKDFAERFNRATQYMEDHKGSDQISSQAQLLNQAMVDFSDSKNYAIQASASLNEAQEYRNQAAYSRTTSTSVNTNKTQPALEAFAAQKGISLQEAASSKYQQEFAESVKSRLPDNSNNLGSVESIQKKHEENQQAIPKAPTELKNKTNKARQEINAGGKRAEQNREVLNEKTSEQKSQVTNNLNNQDNFIKEKRKEIKNQREKTEQKFGEAKSETPTERGVKGFVGIRGKHDE